MHPYLRQSTESAKSQAHSQVVVGLRTNPEGVNGSGLASIGPGEGIKCGRSSVLVLVDEKLNDVREIGCRGSQGVG
jgi:hypothetical protein